MRLSAPLLTLAGTVAGAVAAVVAYQAAATTGTTTEPASVTTDDSVPVGTTSWLPCERGWKVEGTTCVRVKEKVVVVHDLPAPAAEPVAPAGVRSSARSSSGDDQGEDDSASAESDDHAEVESGDDSGQEVEQSSDEPEHQDVGGDD